MESRWSHIARLLASQKWPALFGIKVCSGLLDRRLLECVFGTQTGQHPCALSNDRFGMIGGGSDIAIIEAHQQLSGINSLASVLRHSSGAGMRRRTQYGFRVPPLR